MSKEILGVFHDDPKMSSEDLEEINILSKDECAQAWIEYVSVFNRHLVKMQDDEWPKSLL